MRLIKLFHKCEECFSLLMEMQFARIFNINLKAVRRFRSFISFDVLL